MISNRYVQHPLIFNNGILGFTGYSADGLFCVPANRDDNFLLYGIAENSLLIVDRKQPFTENKLNVFWTDALVHGKRKLKLSLTWLASCLYIGRVIMSANHYD